MSDSVQQYVQALRVRYVRVGDRPTPGHETTEKQEKKNILYSSFTRPSEDFVCVFFLPFIIFALIFSLSN